MMGLYGTRSERSGGGYAIACALLVYAAYVVAQALQQRHRLLPCMHHSLAPQRIPRIEVALECQWNAVVDLRRCASCSSQALRTALDRGP